VQADESELARVAARASNENSPWLEQRPELLVGEVRVTCCRRRHRVRRRHFHESVDSNDRAIDAHDQWIDIDTGNVGPGCGKLRQGEQHCRELGAIHRSLTTKRVEQLLSRQPVDHLLRIDECDRNRSKHNVGDRFSKNAADPEHHVAAELRITHDTGDQLAIADNHRSHQQRHVTVGRGRLRQQLVGGTGDGASVGQVQLHQPALGLVRNGVAAELHRHRVPKFGGGHRCRARVCNLAFVGQRHTELA